MAVITKATALEPSRKTSRGKIQVGMTVEFNFGLSIMKGMVFEDRGPIGVHGRHLFSVLYASDQNGNPPIYDMGIELPEDDLEVHEHS